MILDRFLPAVVQLVLVLQLLQAILLQQIGGSQVRVISLGGRHIKERCIFGYISLGANGIQPTDKLIQLLRLTILLRHDGAIFFRCDMYISQCVFFEKQLQLSPVVLPPSLVLGIFKCVHGYSSGFIP